MDSSKAILPLLTKYIASHKETFDPNNIRDLIDIYLQKIKSMNDGNQDSSFYKEDGGERKRKLPLKLGMMSLFCSQTFRKN